MAPPVTSTASLLVPNATPEQIANTVNEHALWIERQKQHNHATHLRIVSLEADVTDWRNDQRQANELVVAKLEAVAKQLDTLDDSVMVIRTARDTRREVLSKVAAVVVTLVSLFIAAKEAGLLG